MTNDSRSTINRTTNQPVQRPRSMSTMKKLVCGMAFVGALLIEPILKTSGHSHELGLSMGALVQAQTLKPTERTALVTKIREDIALMKVGFAKKKGTRVLEKPIQSPMIQNLLSNLGELGLVSMDQAQAYRSVFGNATTLNASTFSIAITPVVGALASGQHRLGVLAATVSKKQGAGRLAAVPVVAVASVPPITEDDMKRYSPEHRLYLLNVLDKQLQDKQLQYFGAFPETNTYARKVRGKKQPTIDNSLIALNRKRRKEVEAINPNDYEKIGQISRTIFSEDRAIKFIVLLKKELEKYKSHSEYADVKDALVKEMGDSLLKSKAISKVMSNAIFEFSKVLPVDNSPIAKIRAQLFIFRYLVFKVVNFENSLNKGKITLGDAKILKPYIAAAKNIYPSFDANKFDSNAALALSIAIARESINKSRASGTEKDMAMRLLDYAQKGVLANPKRNDQLQFVSKIQAATTGALAISELEMFSKTDKLWKAGLTPSQKSMVLLNLTEAIADAKWFFNFEVSIPRIPSLLLPEWAGNTVLDAISNISPSIRIQVENGFYDPLGQSVDNMVQKTADEFEKQALKSYSLYSDDKIVRTWNEGVSVQTKRASANSLVEEGALLGNNESSVLAHGTDTSTSDHFREFNGRLNSELYSEDNGYYYQENETATNRGLKYPSRNVLIPAENARNAALKEYSSIPLGTKTKSATKTKPAGNPADLAPMYAKVLSVLNRGYADTIQLTLNEFDKLKKQQDADGTSARISKAISEKDTDIKFAYERAFALRDKAKSRLKVLQANLSSDIRSGTVKNAPYDQHRVKQLAVNAFTALQIPGKMGGMEGEKKPSIGPVSYDFDSVRIVEHGVVKDVSDIIGDNLHVRFPNNTTGPLDKVGLSTEDFNYRAQVWIKLNQGEYLLNPRYIDTDATKQAELRSQGEPMFLGKREGNIVYKTLRRMELTIATIGGKKQVYYNLDLSKGAYVPLFNQAFKKIENEVSTPPVNSPIIEGVPFRKAMVSPVMYTEPKLFKKPKL